MGRRRYSEGFTSALTYFSPEKFLEGMESHLFCLMYSLESDILTFQTGPFTEGKPTVTAVASLIYIETDILQLAAVVEKTACHPISTAILNKAKILKLQLPSIIGQLTEPGFGTMVEVDGSIVAVGTMDWVNERFQRKSVAYELMDLENRLGDLSFNGISLLNQSTSVVYVGREDEGIIGAIAISDILRCKVNNEEAPRERASKLSSYQVTGKR